MSLLARDIMSDDVVSVQTTMDLRDLAKLFLARGITGAPVIDEDGNLAGVVSQTDLIYYNLTRDDELVLSSDFYQKARVEGRHIPQGFQIEDCNTGTVADAMTPVVYSVSARASIDSVSRLMTRQHIHRVIVRKGKRVAGVISALDVLEALSKAAQPAKKKKSARGKSSGSKVVGGKTAAKSKSSSRATAKKPVRRAALPGATRGRSAKKSRARAR